MRNPHAIFDTHAHYHDSRFVEGKEAGDVDALLDALFAGDICGVVDIGTDLETSRKAIALAEAYPGIYAAVGIYPGSCPMTTDPAVIESVMDELRVMLRHPKVKAIGEIGFDFHYDDVPKDIQAVWFERQLQLAEEVGVPILIHDREAHGATMELLRKYPRVHGVLHSFSGACEMAEELVKMGYYISISGVVTFKNARKLCEVAAMLPSDRMLIETDAPYLTPVPHRGECNHSGYLVYTAEKIAGLRAEAGCADGCSAEDVADITRRNACRVFGITESSLSSSENPV
ncbi:MAG: TatD family hydrolase [Clostridia bacterium]|nr:TatD family hydrolase [Clostridia bacterium]